MSDSEDDYLSMALPTSEPSKPLSSLAKRQAAQRTAADRARVKSKAELESDRLLRLEKGLRQDLTQPSPDNAHDQLSQKKSKGAAMMEKLGYKGGALGRAPSPPATKPVYPSSSAAHGTQPTTSPPPHDARLTEPIRVHPRAKNAGIGHASEEAPGLKRAREALDAEEARIKRLRTSMGGYRERNALEGQEKRLEGQWWGAMRVCSTLSSQDRERDGRDGERITPRDVGVEWRAVLYREAEEEREKAGKRERGRRMDRIEDEKEDEDRVAMGETVGELPVVGEEEDPEEDEEMEEFLAMEPGERLARTVRYLREKWWYCFWCKARYDDKELDGCPGVTEEEHE